MFGKTYFKWTEPWLFVPRTRTGRSWLIRLTFALIAGAVLAVATFFLRQGPGVAMQALTAGAILTLLVLAILDAPYLARDVWIDEKGFHCHGDAGDYYYVHNDFTMDRIQHAQLDRARDLKKSYHRLQLSIDGTSLFEVGVPQRLSLENLAQKLYELKIPAVLDGWEPRPAGTRAVSQSLFGGNLSDASIGVRNASASGTTSPIGDDEERLFLVSHQITAGLLAGWPGLMGIVVLIACVAHAIWYWSVNPIWVGLIWIGAGLVLVVLSLMWIAWWAGPLETGYILKIAKQRIRDRKKSSIKPDDNRMVPVSNYTEEACKKRFGMSFDDGFLVADNQIKSLCFEGNKNRWKIPYDAIIEAQVEEFTIGAETADGVGLVKFFVHLAFQSAEGRQDYYLRLAHEKFGAEAKAAKQRAEDLLLYIDGHVHS
jgi:hypothetical protein